MGWHKTKEGVKRWLTQPLPAHAARPGDVYVTVELDYKGKRFRVGRICNAASIKPVIAKLDREMRFMVRRQFEEFA